MKKISTEITIGTVIVTTIIIVLLTSCTTTQTSNPLPIPYNLKGEQPK